VLAVVSSAADTIPVEPPGAAELLDRAQGIISNAGGGDWTRETLEWQQAAAAWRDQYSEWLRGAEMVEERLRALLRPYAGGELPGTTPEDPADCLKRLMDE